MSSSLAWNNLVTYSLQIGLLVGLAAFVPALLRLRLPGAKLAYWQILLATCLLLPLVGTWKHEVVPGNVDIATTVAVVQTANHPARPMPSKTQVALLLLAAGALMRLVWLAVGFWKLRRYRRRGLPVEQHYYGLWQGTPEAYPTLLLSEEVASPVTFGWRNPVVLLPARFPDLEGAARDAILCHELLHVWRRDWLFTVTEEFVRAVFWFHPAIWWLLGEIQLAREQAVDREVVEWTQAREQYVDALLAIAGAKPQLDLAPAPLFLRKRHLKQRVISILKEVRMSKKRLVSTLALGLGILAAASWFVTGTFPLAASPQVVNDGQGVTVDIGTAAIMHRAPVVYPEKARKAGVQGTVVVEAALDASGNVTDAHVLSGPDELRRAALESVLQWHFANGAAGTTRQVSIAFQLPATSEKAVQEAAIAPAAATQLEQQARSQPELAAAKRQAEMAARSGKPSFLTGRTVRTINVLGLSDQVRSELLAKLPLKEGDTLSADGVESFTRAAREFDEHLRISAGTNAAGEAVLTVTPPNYVPAVSPTQLRIGGNVQQTKLLKQPHPVYPPEAKQARIQGQVQLRAVIATDGTIKSLEVISGEPVLVQAAMEAVRQWVYEPTLLNGNPVEVITQIDVNFTLSQ